MHNFEIANDIPDKDPIIDEIWKLLHPINGLKEDDYKRDFTGRVIKKDQFRKSNSPYGWFIARIIPVNNGGNNDLKNLLVIKSKSSLRHRYLITWTSIYWATWLLFLLFLLVDIWNNAAMISSILNIDIKNRGLEIFKTFGYTMVGGALGSILYHIYKIIGYYALGTYNARWIPKHLLCPLEGAILALIVVCIMKSGLATFNGGNISVQDSSIANFFSFGIGGIIGYGLRHVVRWLQDITKAIFKSSEPTDTPSEN